MTTPATVARCTFAVHDVEPETEPLPGCLPHEAAQALLGAPVEALCDYTTRCLTGVTGHPLFAAAHAAWCDHRPLVLSPDVIWIAVLQGLAQHVKNHPEHLRDRFVAFAGRKELAVVRDDLVTGSPENAWPEVIAAFSAQVRAELGPDLAWLTADFSTTGPRERIAAEIVLLDALQPFFEYRSYAVCGIPTVSLEGTPADWQRLADKVEQLEGFDLTWWLDHLRPIVAQFVRAARGDVDLDHWRNIYKRLDAYGGDHVNGWLVKLVPYLKDYVSGQYTRRNELLGTPFEPYPPAPAVPELSVPYSKFVPESEKPTVGPRALPLGISAAPFTFVPRESSSVAMEFLGGFLGVTQDAATLALRPHIGWAVRRRSGFAQVLLALREHPGREPLPPVALGAAIRSLRETCHLHEMPGDLVALYQACDGVNLFATEDVPAYRIRALGALASVRPRYPADFRPRIYVDQQRNPIFAWARFADLRDGTFLAFDFDSHPAEPTDVSEKQSWETLREREVWHVIHCREDEADPRQAYRVVAWSFGEFLRRALASGGRHYWDEPGFEPRGDAFSVPRYAGTFPRERVADARA